jgi:hypothetical protein
VHSLRCHMRPKIAFGGKPAQTQLEIVVGSNTHGTVTGDCSVFTHSYILNLSYSYRLCEAYISSLHKSCSRFSRTTYIASVNHIYRVCRAYTTFVQLAPQTTSRVVPRMTTQPVPASPGDPPGMNYGASPRTISKRSTIQHDPVKLVARQGHCRYRQLQ